MSVGRGCSSSCWRTGWRSWSLRHSMYSSRGRWVGSGSGRSTASAWRPYGSTGAVPESFMKTKILLVHNFYQQPGGEDQVFAGESALLEVNEHEVVRFTVHNDAIKEMGGLGAAARTLW